MARINVVTNILWVVGIVGAILFCVPHFFRSLENVQGVSIAQVTTVAVYLGFHLTLAWGAYRAHPSWVVMQTISVYCTWLVLVIALVVAICINGSYVWSVQDTTITSAVLLCTIGIILGAFMSRVKFFDPAVRAGLAIAYKAVPQALLAWKIATEGGGGIPMVSVAVGHMTILARLGQILFMVQEAGWDRNRKWLFISETANEISWIVASIAWALT